MGIIPLGCSVFQKAQRFVPKSHGDSMQLLSCAESKAKSLCLCRLWKQHLSARTFGLECQMAAPPRSWRFLSISRAHWCGRAVPAREGLPLCTWPCTLQKPVVAQFIMSQVGTDLSFSLENISLRWKGEALKRRSFYCSFNLIPNNNCHCQRWAWVWWQVGATVTILTWAHDVIMEGHLGVQKWHKI